MKAVEQNRIKYRLNLKSVFPALLLVAAGWVFLWGWGLEKTVFSESYYRDLVEKIELPSRTQEFLIAELIRGRGETAAFEGMLNRLLRETITREWLAEQAAQLAIEAAAFIRGEQPALVVEIDLAERREILLNLLTVEMLENIPPQLANLELDEETVRGFIGQFAFPDQVTLISVPDRTKIDTGIGRTLANVQSARGFFRYVTPVVLLLLVLIIIYRSGFAAGVKKVALAIAVSGASFSLGLLLAGMLLQAPLTEWLAAHPVAERLYGGETEVWSAVFSHTRRLLMQPALFFTGAGLALGAGYFLRSGSKARGAS